MIILHFHLQPQFIYELLHINFTSVSLHTSQVAHQAGAHPGNCSMKRLGVFLFLPVHRRVTPSIKFPCTHLYTCESSVLPKNTTKCPRPGLEPGPLDPETSELTISHRASTQKQKHYRDTKKLSCHKNPRPKQPLLPLQKKIIYCHETKSIHDKYGMLVKPKVFSRKASKMLGQLSASRFTYSVEASDRAEV